jgi:hypothetical protein
MGRWLVEPELHNLTQTYHHSRYAHIQAIPWVPGPTEPVHLVHTLWTEEVSPGKVVLAQ